MAGSANPSSSWRELRARMRSARSARARAHDGAISVYAQGDDYHDVMKAKLRQLAQFVQYAFRRRREGLRRHRARHGKAAGAGGGPRLAGQAHQSRLARIRLLAVSRFAVHDARTRADAPEEDHCGQCRRCLDACPTDAFTAPYRIDARRCISYLTIEHKGHIPREFREAIGNRIYGCDDCLAVCPWNKFAQAAREARFHARDALRAPALPISRAGRCGVPRTLPRLPHQTHRPRPIRPQCADRDRQFGRRVVGGSCRAAA